MQTEKTTYGKAFVFDEFGIIGFKSHHLTLEGDRLVTLCMAAKSGMG
jgi:hypothetical protein